MAVTRAIRLNELQHQYGFDAGKVIYQQETELAQLKRGANLDATDEELKAAVEAMMEGKPTELKGISFGQATTELENRKANRVAFAMANKLNRTLRYLLGELISSGRVLMQQSSNGQIDPIKACAFGELMYHISQETNVDLRPVTWPEDYEELRGKLRMANEQLGHLETENGQLRERLKGFEDNLPGNATLVAPGILPDPPDPDEQPVG